MGFSPIRERENVGFNKSQMNHGEEVIMIEDEVKKKRKSRCKGGSESSRSVKKRIFEE